MAHAPVNANSPSSRAVVPPPPPEQRGKSPQQASLLRMIVFVIFFGLIGTVSFAFGMFSLGTVLLLLALLYGWLIYSSHIVAKWVVRHNQAFEHATRGLLEEAEAISAQLPKRARERGALMRAQGLLHAFIALQRGRFEDGILHATKAIEGKGFVLWGASVYANLGLGIRAILHASLGHEERCLADIARAEADPDLRPETWARCKLAKAILASKDEAKRTELVALLREGRGAMASLSPRERVLFRALESTVRIDVGAAYRESGQRVEEADAEAVALSSWVSTVVPGAAGFIKARQHEELAASGALEGEFAPRTQPLAAPNAAVQVTAQQAMINTSRGRKSLALWIVLLAALYGVFRWVNLSNTRVPDPNDDPEVLQQLRVDDAPSLGATLFSPQVFVSWFPWTLVLLVAGLFAYRTYSYRRAQRMFAAASMHRVRGNVAECMRILDGLANTNKPGIAATALQNRAQEREACGDFAGALADLELAMTRLNLSGKAVVVANDLVHPAIIVSHAFVLAVLGRLPEAEAGYARFVNDYPAYPFATSAKLRVRVAIALREGDEAKARAIARRRTMDLPMPLHDELLYDLLDLSANPTPSREELARMREEFSHARDAATWVDVVAPGLRERVLSGAGAARVSTAIAPPMEEVLREDAADLATQRGAV